MYASKVRICAPTAKNPLMDYFSFVINIPELEKQFFSIYGFFFSSKLLLLNRRNMENIPLVEYSFNTKYSKAGVFLKFLALI